MQRTVRKHSTSHALRGRARYIVEQRCASLIEAPVGYGKSVLLREIEHQSDHAVLVESPSALEGLVVGPIDDLHVIVDFEDPDVGHLDRLASAAGTTSLTVAGRYISGDVRALLRDFGLAEFGPGNLRLDAEEAFELFRPLGSEAWAGTMAEWTVAELDGWPAPITALVDQLSLGGPEAIAALMRSASDPSSYPVLDRFLQALRREWPADVSAAVDQFGSLGRVTLAAYEEVVGLGSMGRAVRSGVPYLVQPDGWFSLTPLMRQHLRRPPTPAAAQAIAPALARTGGLLSASQVLTGASAFEAAADLLLQSEPDRLDGTDPHQLLALVDIVAPHATSRPELGLLRARALENLGDLQGAVDALEEVARRAAAGTSIEVDISLELRRHSIMRGEAVDDLERLDVSTPAQRARLREAEGLREALSQDPVRVEASIDALRARASEWESLGFPGRAVSLLRTLAAMPLTHLGRFADAIDAVHHARQLSWNRLYDRALCSVLLVILGAWSARIDLVEREMTVARSLRTVVDLPWLDLYLAAASVDVAVYRGQPAEALSHAALTSELMGGLADHPTAVTLNAKIASSLAVAGQHDAARSYLERAQRHRQRNEAEVLIAEVVVASRRGDVDAATRAGGEVEASSVVPADRRWRTRLELGLANGDDATLSRGRHGGEALRLDQLVEALTVAAEPTLTMVHALGRLRVRHRDGSEDLITGRPADLLAHLVCSGGSSPIETTVEALWPDEADRGHGRQLLRNPLSRLRRSLGPESISRTDHAISLGPQIGLDIDDFEAFARRADQSSDASAVEHAVDALNMYQPLLSDRSDLGEGNLKRTALMVRAGGLLDMLLATDSLERPSTSWLLATALRVDADAETRLIEIAERSIEENNPACAAAAVEAALAAVKRLEVPSSPRLEAARTATAVLW